MDVLLKDYTHSIYLFIKNIPLEMDKPERDASPELSRFQKSRLPDPWSVVKLNMERIREERLWQNVKTASSSSSNEPSGKRGAGLVSSIFTQGVLGNCACKFLCGVCRWGEA